MALLSKATYVLAAVQDLASYIHITYIIFPTSNSSQNNRVNVTTHCGLWKKLEYL